VLLVADRYVAAENGIVDEVEDVVAEGAADARRAPAGPVHRAFDPAFAHGVDAERERVGAAHRAGPPAALETERILEPVLRAPLDDVLTGAGEGGADREAAEDLQDHGAPAAIRRERRADRELLPVRHASSVAPRAAAPLMWKEIHKSFAASAIYSPAGPDPTIPCAHG
jgi:hypothetical protein